MILYWIQMEAETIRLRSTVLAMRISPAILGISRKQADEISYIWDALIEAFTTNMLNGTSVVLDGYDFDLKKNELGVRYMALEPRFARRSRGEALSSALEIGKTTDIFFRAMMGSAGSIAGETAFFIQTFKYLHWMKKKGGYEKYRIMRTEYAQVYAKGLLERFPHLKRVVGISCEPRDQGGNSSGYSTLSKPIGLKKIDARSGVTARCTKCCVVEAVARPGISRVGNGLGRGNGHTSRKLLNRRQRRALEAKARRCDARESREPVRKYVGSAHQVDCGPRLDQQRVEFGSTQAEDIGACDNA